MAKARVKLEEEPPKQLYFVSEKENLQFIKSGCHMLDLVLGGGWVLGRMSNVIGDKSTAKTALGTEALINFKTKYPDGNAAYRDIEEAFDEDYAEAMGLPIDDIDFGDPDEPVETVQAFARDLEAFCDVCIKEGNPGLYILDSFDALSDEDEMANDIGKATMGMAKAKTASILFRKLKGKIRKANVCLLIISQVRENIGIGFGEKYKRSGGKALDHYAAHCLWLAHTGMLKRTIKHIERPFGITVRAKCKKNKVGLPFRECDFVFRFGYGVDDLWSTADWVIRHKVPNDTLPSGVTKLPDYMKKLEDSSAKEVSKVTKKLNKLASKAWNESEVSFIPKHKKYG